MKLLGERNWWLPKRLQWLPQVGARGRGGARHGLSDSCTTKPTTRGPRSARASRAFSYRMPNLTQASYSRVMSPDHVDVLIVGAGLSGIGAGYHLQTHCPARPTRSSRRASDIGGTWDLFRYPGIRSDSDMYTLGYRFRPWEDAKSIADGASILRYISETAREHGIDAKIRFSHRVVRAEWSSDDARWTVEARRDRHRRDRHR